MPFDTIPDIRGQFYSRHRVYASSVSDLQAPAGDQRANRVGANLPWLFRLGWEFLQKSQAQDLYYACIYSAGQHPMYFAEWRSRAWVNAYVGLGDGTSNPVTLPVIGGSAVVLRANGVPVAGTLSSGTGYFGQDRFLPTNPITSGQVLRGDWTGRHVRLVTFLSLSLGLRPRSAPLAWVVSAEVYEKRGKDLL